MNKNQKGFVAPLIAIIVAVLVIGGGVSYYLKIKTKDSLVKSEVVSTTTPSITEKNRGIPTITTIDPTSDWQSYSDNKFGYSLKYPSGYTLYKYDPPCGSSLNNENGQNIIIWIDSFLKHDSSPGNQYSQDLKDGKIIDFNVNINDPEDKCVRAHYSYYVEFGTAPGYKLVDSKNIVINGYEVLERNYVESSVPEDAKVFNFSTYRFKEGDTYFTLLYNNGLTVDMENGKSLFNLFLKSFKLN